MNWATADRNRSSASPSGDFAGGYRPDVDALRAVAVISVLLFHLQVPAISGGYVGVDVFFVISGYLITKTILAAIAKDSFTFAAFYARRIRRIVPSFLAVAIVTLLAGAIILPPAILLEAARSAASALGFASNVYFWRQTGYFDADKYSKPFLHTWSLGIEEQFYLIWPIFLVVALKIIGLRGTLVAIAGLCLASFALSVFWLSSVTVTLPFLGLRYTDISDAFYVLPFRMWELALGGMAAFPLLDRAAARVPTTLRTAICIGALAVLLWCIDLYTPQTRFPGWTALPPALAAFGLIMLGRGSVLDWAARPSAVRYIGQLSYSLYLTHWPLIVLYKQATFTELDPVSRIGLIAASLATAAMLYHLVEQPFRIGRLSTRHGMRPAGWAAVSAGCLALAAGSGALLLGSGLPSRMLNPCVGQCEAFQLRHAALADVDPIALSFGGGINRVGASDPVPTRRALLIGDSHAGHLAPAFDAIGRASGIAVDVWTFPGCPPIFGTYKIYWEVGLTQPSATQLACQRQIAEWQRYLHAAHYDLVILAGRWSTLFEPTSYGSLKIEYAQLAAVGVPVGERESGRQVFADHLRQTVDAITATGAHVLIVGQIPENGRVIDHCNELSRFLYTSAGAGAAIAERCQGMDREVATARLAFSNAVIAGSVASPKSTAVLLSGPLCPEGAARCITVENGCLLYRNVDHLNVSGALRVAPYLLAAVVKLLGNAIADVKLDLSSSCLLRRDMAQKALQ